MLLMLFFGTMDTVVLKLQDEVVVGPRKADTGPPSTFNHPYLQCAIMFVGELLCYLVYILKSLFYRSEEVNQEGKASPALLAIPAGFDIIASSLVFVALTVCAASVYQMVRGFIVVITALMALVFLGRP